jgi:hypothetical protein
VPRKYLPPVIERYRLGTVLACAHLALGLAMSAVAAFIMVWAPDMAARDAAHYSGLMVRPFTYLISMEKPKAFPSLTLI